MANERITTYLQDHLAGASAGLELARRAASNNSDHEFGPRLEGLAEEIEKDREALELVMAEMDIHPDPIKNAGGWLAEKFGRLKLNGSLTSYSPLSRLIELEGLMLGVTGKRALWESLTEYPGDDAIAAVDLAELRDRAERQREELASMRRDAAAEALREDA